MRAGEKVTVTFFESNTPVNNNSMRCVILYYITLLLDEDSRTLWRNWYTSRRLFLS